MKKGVSLYAFLTMALEVSGQLHVPATLCTHYTGSGWDPETVWALWKTGVSCHCRETILGSTVIKFVVVTIPTQLSHFRKARFKKAGWMDKGKKESLDLPSNEDDCPPGDEKVPHARQVLRLFYPKDTESRLSQNVGICLRNFTASHCRRR
jgi:hypothetical protein